MTCSLNVLCVSCDPDVLSASPPALGWEGLGRSFAYTEVPASLSFGKSSGSDSSPTSCMSLFNLQDVLFHYMTIAVLFICVPAHGDIVWHIN